jgi:ubiquinone/menaquinone biosynthesis C-methylase UbiE
MQNYWDKVYSEKSENEMSWFQEHPAKSLELIKKACPDKHSAIIDIGGGDSRLVDHLLNEGYIDITILDVSETSLEK